MLIGTHNNDDKVTIEGEATEVVDQFEYLGRILSKDGSDMPALEDRIGKLGVLLRKRRHHDQQTHIYENQASHI